MWFRYQCIGKTWLEVVVAKLQQHPGARMGHTNTRKKGYKPILSILDKLETAPNATFEVLDSKKSKRMGGIRLFIFPQWTTSLKQ